MKALITFLFIFNSIAYSQIGRRINNVEYSHSTVGTSAADAIAAINVDSKLKGWLICHDAGSASVYLAVSNTADPDLDGVRLEPSQCFECTECGFLTLKDANVKGSAASTGYSVIQLK